MWSVILDSTIRESALHIVDSSTMGRTLVSGPFGLPGFCRGIGMPWPKSNTIPVVPDWIR